MIVAFLEPRNSISEGPTFLSYIVIVLGKLSFAFASHLPVCLFFLNPSPAYRKIVGRLIFFCLAILDKDLREVLLIRSTSNALALFSVCLGERALFGLCLFGMYLIFFFLWSGIRSSYGCHFPKSSSFSPFLEL